MCEKNLCVVIPVFNGWRQTRICLDRLQASTYQHTRILGVDHGSTDGTQAGLASDFPGVTRIEGTADMWWTAAINVGIRAALEQGAELIMLLNNDCYVEADTIESLVTHIQHTGNEAIVAPLQRRLPSGDIANRRLTTCFLLGFSTLLLPGKVDYTPNQPQLARTGLIIGGRGVIIPADIFKHVGLFDENALPHYGADHDFYLRCRKAGISLFQARDVVVDIDESRTTLSAGLGRLTFSAFLDTLRNRRSHRNLPDMTTLFRLHYPVPGLYPVGVVLNLVRYTLFYGLARLSQLIPRGRPTTG